MKEKERKKNLAIAERIQKKDYPPKSIEFLVAFHKSQRPGLVSEVFDDLLGEYGNLPVKLERYGENSLFWKS